MVEKAGIFLGCSQGPKCNLGDFFPPILKKDKEDCDFHSVNTHKLYGDVLLQFNGTSMCNS